MRLTDLLKLENVIVPLEATDKTAAITELIGRLADGGDLSDRDLVLDAVLERESTRTTGIGSGLAIPHGKTKGVKQITLALGKPAQPIDFQAVDNRGVQLIWLLASPPDKTVAHIQALSGISKLFLDDVFRAKAYEATDAQTLYDLIVKKEDAS